MMSSKLSAQHSVLKYLPQNVFNCPASHKVLETQRLILRHVDPVSDFEAWADCFSDEETMRGLGGGPGMTRAQSIYSWL